MIESSEIQRSLGRIEGKQDMILNTVTALDSRVSDNEKDIGSMKSRVSWYAGAATVIAVVVTKVSDFLPFLK